MTNNQNDNYDNIELIDYEYYECKPAYNATNNNDLLLDQFSIISSLDNCIFKIPKHYDELIYLSSGYKSINCAARNCFTNEMIMIKKFYTNDPNQPNNQSSSKSSTMETLFIKNDYFYHEIYKEFRMMTIINHTNIMSLYDAFIVGKSSKIFDIYFVTELFDYDLTIILSEYNLNDAEMSNILFQIFNGLHYLHHNNIVHGNLNPSNIVLRFNQCRKDFDVKLINFTKNLHKTNFSMDIWSIGLIMIELLKKQQNFIEYNHDDIEILQEWTTIESVLIDCNNVEKVIIEKKPLKKRLLQSIQKILKKNPKKLKYNSGDYTDDHDYYQESTATNAINNNDDITTNNENAQNLLEKILNINSNQRITIDEAIKHPYFSLYNSLSNDEHDCQDQHENDDISMIYDHNEDNNHTNLNNITPIAKVKIDVHDDANKQNDWKCLLFNEICSYHQRKQQQQQKQHR